MAKDPRFNFYPDNWDGGTNGFTLEQEGAYLRMVIMQSRIGRFTANQALDTLMESTRGNAAASAKLWEFLMPKFETDGKVYWSARLEKEIAKSRSHSAKQSERAKKRHSQPKLPFGTQSGTAAAHAEPQAFPVNGSGTGIRTGSEQEEVQEEAEYDQLLDRWTQYAIDGTDEEIRLMEQRDVNMTGVPWPPGFDRKAAILDHRDLAHRYEWRFETQQKFRHSLLKVMRELKTKKVNGNHGKDIRTPAAAVIEPGRGGFGKL